MSNATLTVKVKSISKPEAVGAKGTLKQTLVGTTFGDYPQVFEFEAFGQRRDAIANVKVGDVIDITAELRGREWTSSKTGKTSVFMSLSILSVATGAGAETTSEEVVGVDVSDVGDDEDMPF